MNVLDAVRLVARDYPGGAAALAPRMDKSPSTLQKEIAGAQGYKLGLADAVTISQFADDRRILNAFAAELGCHVMQLPEMQSPGDCPMGASAAVMRETSHLLAQVSETLADGYVSDNELQRCERELSELILAAQHLQALLRARNQASKPDGERRQAVRRAADRGEAR